MDLTSSFYSELLGMGKTVEVLGLIMATLPELKELVEIHQKGKTTFDGDSYYSAQSSDGASRRRYGE